MREALELIRQTIKKAAPEAEEVISYLMPAYKYHGIVAWFAINKEHIGLYIRPQIMRAFEEQLKLFRHSKSTIRFPVEKSLPLNFTVELVRFSARKNLENQFKKKSKNDLNQQ